MTRTDPQGVSIAEVAALTAWLRVLSAAGADADDSERERFLADKRELLARITDQQETPTDHGPQVVHTTFDEIHGGHR